MRCATRRRLALTEEHDIVYRARRSRATRCRRRKPHRPSSRWSREIVPDDVLLFRYSALTFNGHRIHYDRKYVTEVEGYPGLIVHGPLIATLLADLVRRQRPDARAAQLQLQGRAAHLRPASLPRLRQAAGRRQGRAALGAGP
jgi:3-methylfumaryl-CoA hydratase